MDAFKLLTKSTKLSSRRNEPIRLVTVESKSQTFSNSRKRKRDGPSDGEHTRTGLNGNDRDAPDSESFQEVQSPQGHLIVETKDWTDDETRSFYKRRNIKITNLRVVRDYTHHPEASKHVIKKNLGRVFHGRITICRS